MLLTWIAEVAEESLALEPGDRRVEWETNTWSLGAEDEDRRLLSAAKVVGAFERTAAGIRERIRELGFSGIATFYVRHDGQAGQLRCSTGSVPPDELLLNDKGFLGDSMPGDVAWSDLVGPGRRGERLGAGRDRA